jgi:hypothetical protein
MSSIVCLFVTKAGEQDEIIQIGGWTVPDMYEVTYTPSDLKRTKYRFYLDRSSCDDYVYNLLKLLSLDSKPFHEIQISTRIAPSVVFDIGDLNDTFTRKLIEDTIRDALDFNPSMVRTE